MRGLALQRTACDAVGGKEQGERWKRVLAMAMAVEPSPLEGQTQR